MVMGRSFARGGVVILGRWLPLPVAWLAGLTATLSILGALWRPLLAAGVLVPSAVWAGQIWRLPTWAFFDTEPISLVFACLLIAWLGPDLCQAWGARRFVAVYLSCAVLAGGLTSLLALALPAIRPIGGYYASPWAVIGALIIAWATLFPGRRILIFFVLPAEGRTLILLTLGFTALFAVFQEWQLFVPHFVAQGLMLLYLDRLRFVRLGWLRLRLAAYERELRRRSSHLRVVRRDDEQQPPRYH
jgi:membrane associated rhomboid family serine protease